MTVPSAFTVTTETDIDLADEFAKVAAATFPLACPPGTTDIETADVIARNLTADHFHAYLTSPIHDVIAARLDAQLVGYALIVHEDPSDPEVRAVIRDHPVTEVSKMYVTPQVHGAGVARALMDHALDSARERRSAAAWLGVSNVNIRAQRFYAKVGFAVVGRKSFWLAGTEQRDYVMARQLDWVK